jgi:hypothetical protein
MPSTSSERLTGAIVGVGLVGVLLTGWLVISELFREPTCPELFGIPACYLVFAGYLVGAVGAWRYPSRVGNVMFYVGAGVVVVIGAYFTASHIGETVECPLFAGLPMCYASLLAGSSMILFDQLRRRRF